MSRVKADKTNNFTLNILLESTENLINKFEALAQENMKLRKRITG